MKATCWIGKREASVQNVPDPQILNARDAVVGVTSTAICGSDLHLYNGFVTSTEKGDVELFHKKLDGCEKVVLKAA